MRRFTKSEPCPICDGHPGMPPGQGVRCWGYESSDGDYAHCSRDEVAGQIQLNEGSHAYPHRLAGACACGKQHGADIYPIGTANRAEIAATYDYTDAAGTLLYQVVRKEPKAFLQRHPDSNGGWTWGRNGVQPVPYRLPALISGACAGDTIWIAEGEKDVNALRAAGLCATCNSGGAGSWPPSFSHYFEQAECVVIVRDKDDDGHGWARDVWKSLRNVVPVIRVVEARTGKDAADHLGAGFSPEEFSRVWPLPDSESDPAGWKRLHVRRSLELGMPYDPDVAFDAVQPDSCPHWPTGLESQNAHTATILPNFRGVTFLTGKPSSGKSYLAIASSVQAAIGGLDVLYLSAEMSASVIAARFLAYCRGEPPARLKLIPVNFGASVVSLVELIEERVGERNVLVVLDSISSYIDQGTGERQKADIHGIGPLKQLTMWAINVRRNTDGAVSFLMLSEQNKDGETKGRFGDHKADLVVSMETEKDDSRVKRVRIVKGWQYQTGQVGLYDLDWQSARLTWVGE